MALDLGAYLVADRPRRSGRADGRVPGGAASRARHVDPVREPRHPARAPDPPRPGEPAGQARARAPRRLLLRAQHAVRRRPRGDRLPSHAARGARAPGAHATSPRGRTWSCASRPRSTAWLADVGFGGGSILRPVALEPGPVAEQFGWRFRLVDDGARTRAPGGAAAGMARLLRVHVRAPAPGRLRGREPLHVDASRARRSRTRRPRSSRRPSGRSCCAGGR